MAYARPVVVLETPVFTRRIKLLVGAYAKNEQDDLTAEQLKELRALVKEELG